MDKVQLIDKFCAKCGKLGTRQPQLHIWAQGGKYKHAPAIGSFGFLLCGTCTVDVETESGALEAFRLVAKSAGMAPMGHYETHYVGLDDPGFLDANNHA